MSMRECEGPRMGMIESGGTRMVFQRVGDEGWYAGEQSTKDGYDREQGTTDGMLRQWRTNDE